MSKEYSVRLVKYQTYYVEAEDMDEAIDIACDLCNREPDAWLEPIDKFEVEEVETND